MDQNNPKPNENSENAEKKDGTTMPSDTEAHSPLIPHPESEPAPEKPQETADETPSVEAQETMQKPLVPEKPESTETPATPPVPPKPRKGLPLPVIIVFVILAFLFGLLLAGWYFQSQLQQAKLSENDTVQPIKETLVIGTNATDPPMEYLNDKGTLMGYDIDLGYRIANEIGVKAEFKNVEWDNIFQELLDKKIDMIMASVTITDERKKLYNFSEPYLNAGQVIISRKDNPLTEVSTLQGKKIAVQKGTTNETEAYKHTTKELVLVYDEYADIAKAVSVGSAEAALSDLTIAKGLISNYDNVKITSDPFTNDYYGIVMRKEDIDLQKKVNEALTVLRVNGYLTDLKQKWLD